MNVNLTQDLLKKAIILAGEEAWTREDALEVVQWAEAHNIIISGVELWHKQGESPQWIATSNYDPKNVQDAAAGAREFVLRFSDDRKALFNISW